MTPAQRCDEIIRMIDEVLDGALRAERGIIPTPLLVDPSFDRPVALTYVESWAPLESRA